MDARAYSLAWPGVDLVPVSIMDPKVGVVYSSSKPVPKTQQYLLSDEYKYVEKISLLKQYNPKYQSDVLTAMDNLITEHKLGSPVSVAVGMSTTPESTQVVLKELMPLKTFLLCILLIPNRKSGEKLTNTLLKYLNNYFEMTCISCGFINRDCVCGVNIDERKKFIGWNAEMTRLGRKETSVQTDECLLSQMSYGPNVPQNQGSFRPERDWARFQEFGAPYPHHDYQDYARPQPPFGQPTHMARMSNPRARHLEQGQIIYDGGRNAYPRYRAPLYPDVRHLPYGCASNVNPYTRFPGHIQNPATFSRFNITPPIEKPGETVVHTTIKRKFVEIKDFEVHDNGRKRTIAIQAKVPRKKRKLDGTSGLDEETDSKGADAGTKTDDTTFSTPLTPPVNKQVPPADGNKTNSPSTLPLDTSTTLPPLTPEIAVYKPKPPVWVALDDSDSDEDHPSSPRVNIETAEKDKISEPVVNSAECNKTDQPSDQTSSISTDDQSARDIAVEALQALINSGGPSLGVHEKKEVSVPTTDDHNHTDEMELDPLNGKFKGCSLCERKPESQDSESGHQPEPEHAVTDDAAVMSEAYADTRTRDSAAKVADDTLVMAQAYSSDSKKSDERDTAKDKDIDAPNERPSDNLSKQTDEALCKDSEGASEKSMTDVREESSNHKQYAKPSINIAVNHRSRDESSEAFINSSEKDPIGKEKDSVRSDEASEVSKDQPIKNDNNPHTAEHVLMEKSSAEMEGVPSSMGVNKPYSTAAEESQESAKTLDTTHNEQQDMDEIGAVCEGKEQVNIVEGSESSMVIESAQPDNDPNVEKQMKPNSEEFVGETIKSSDKPTVDDINDTTKPSSSPDSSNSDSNTLVKATEDIGPIANGAVTFTDDLDSESTAQPLEAIKAKEKKYYHKFLYNPTGDQIWRCSFPKCGQCFDTKESAKFHNTVHNIKENANNMECKSCNFKVPFSKWFELLRHMKEKHYIQITSERFSCFFCGLKFDSEEKLVNHMDYHYSSKYKCIHCGKIYFTWEQVQNHLNDCESKALGKLIVGCPYCTFIFHFRNIRNVHLLSHTDEGLKCAICEDEEQWEQWKLLRKHYQTKHAKILSTKIGPFKDKLPKKRRPPKCPACDEKFKNQELFASHMKRAHDWVPYTLFGCKKCDKSFKSQTSHDRHFKNAHIVEVKCKKCDFVAKNVASIKLHEKQKHVDKQHSCSECGKSFQFYHQLKVYIDRCPDSGVQQNHPVKNNPMLKPPGLLHKL